VEAESEAVKEGLAKDSDAGLGARGLKAESDAVKEGLAKDSDAGLGAIGDR
jgi:hypothetical protein